MNHFARLPDELVQRIFSELEACEAFEKSQLRSVDRRFRRLVPDVHFKELKLQPDVECFGSDFEDLEVVDALEDYKALLDRSAYSVWKSTAQVVNAVLGVFGAITQLLGELSKASPALQCISFAGVRVSLSRSWPSVAEQRALGIVAPRTLQDVARSVLAALPSSSISSLHALPHLRELALGDDRHAGFCLCANETAKLAEIWPLSKKIRCAVRDGSALRELSVLPLEDMRVAVRSTDGLEEALESLQHKADSVRELRLPLEKLHNLELDLDAGAAGPIASGSSGPAAGRDPPPADSEEQRARFAALEAERDALREALCRAAAVVGRSVIDASGARAAKDAAERSAARIRKELEASRAEAARLRARVAELEAASAEQEADLAALAAAASDAAAKAAKKRKRDEPASASSGSAAQPAAGAAGAAASAAGGPRAAGGQENADAGGGRAPAPASAGGGKAGRPRSAPKPLATRNE
eukprot:tig00000430_g652.t1